MAEFTVWKILHGVSDQRKALRLSTANEILHQMQRSLSFICPVHILTSDLPLVLQSCATDDEQSILSVDVASFLTHVNVNVKI